jgi:hypothetical protein
MENYELWSFLGVETFWDDGIVWGVKGYLSWEGEDLKSIEDKIYL